MFIGQSFGEMRVVIGRVGITAGIQLDDLLAVRSCISWSLVTIAMRETDYTWNLEFGFETKHLTNAQVQDICCLGCGHVGMTQHVGDDFIAKCFALKSARS
jgi:hypothetical protein